MGVVYSGFDATLGRRVAVKALRYISAAADKRLYREAKAMAASEHPNLVTIFTCETWNDRPFLVTEYLERGTLLDRLQVDLPTVVESVGWTMDLCAGLTHLHRNQLTHGDIKPSNIGFDRHGTPKFLDFGLTQRFTVKRTFEGGDGHDSRFGTRFYRCPDAAEGISPRPDFDVWSLALVLYEVLAGPDFRGAVRGSKPLLPLPDVRDYRSSVPETIASVLKRALASRPELRPRSAAEFSLWLRRARPIR
jgi:serine/threonine-protein kinase